MILNLIPEEEYFGLKGGQNSQKLKNMNVYHKWELSG